VAKICDFGWAVYSTDEFRTTVCGTPVYKPPEQIMGEKYDEKCDIWAIGILSYEVMIGKLPFKINT
jgi:serine/threonine protein kinase